MPVVPIAIALARPALIVATEGILELQVTKLVTFNVELSLNVAVAISS